MSLLRVTRDLGWGGSEAGVTGCWGWDHPEVPSLMCLASGWGDAKATTAGQTASGGCSLWLGFFPSWWPVWSDFLHGCTSGEPVTKERRHRPLGFSITFAIFYSMKQSRACHVQGMGISPSLDKRGWGGEARGHCRAAGQDIVVWLSL